MRAAVTFGWLLLSLVASTSHAQPASQACRVACRADASLPSPAIAQCLSHCMAGQPLTREGPRETRPSGSAANGRGTAAASQPGASLDAPPDTALSERSVTYGAVYLAAPPNMAFGMVVGLPDRLLAHRQAEFACRAGGASCHMAQDFNLPCAAIGQGVIRAPGAFFMTSDPTTFRVRAITYGIANNPADAMREALEDCSRRERGALTCRIVQSLCGPR